MPGPPASVAAALAANFLGHSPAWYKRTIVAFLVLNPVLFAVSPYLAGWALVFEFIFTLAMPQNSSASSAFGRTFSRTLVNMYSSSCFRK